jgi:hypothetical protein
MRAIRARPMIVLMGDATGSERAEESKAADPYGDVALGVECAWPQDLHNTMTPAEEQGE